MDQSDSVPMANYERNLGKRRRRSEGEYLGKNEGEKGVCNLVKFERNLGKRRRCCEGKNEGKKGVYNLLDRISAMPDEILVSILSLLPLKEATATSILSRRWQYVWMSTMVLNFDANFDVGSNICRFVALKRKLRDLESARYVNWVNRVVERHRGPNIEEFSVCFQLNDRFTSSIDKWVQFAIEKGVTTLVLKFFSQLDSASLNFYAFPHKLLGLEKKCLYSYIPSLHPCGYKVGFQSLKVLHFQWVDVTDEVLEYFLSNCAVLERVTVYGTKSLVNLRVVRPSAALKHLAIGACLGLQGIEICEANLVSFKYDGSVTNLLLTNVPLLVEVSISYISNPRAFIELFSSQLSCCLSQLEILMLTITRVDYNPKHVFPMLANLKHLELIVRADYRLALHHLTSFLKASPFLQRLVLKLDFIVSLEDIEKIKKAAKCPHHYLKVVEIVGYRARASAVDHILFLIKSATALEKIVIDPLRRWAYPCEPGSEELSDEAEAREHAVQLIKTKLPSTVEFVCL
ncbi:PREDICTED: putative FBD-associated F-box protein At5g56700 isoform X1 [Prunus mume]|uniref:FBD-associated F-box protein At5g56700 isoform X1 n=1 Tax=Prunus mume TaxID=102107 RepID=A0ABM0P989_PRUMU|nr:PREDICTED: putative FBD-associated F-box protein At5g56700 isoform X1 [Prunus mume]